MILADTSVWVDHLQRGNNGLAERLLGGLVCTHPYVVGEVALGNLKQRATVLERFSTCQLWLRQLTLKCLHLLTPTHCMERVLAMSMSICWLLCF